MHWADVLAGELRERGDEHTLATGITPSGPIHVGNLRELLTTEAVHRALIDQGVDSTLIYIADSYDPLRKVYPYLADHASIDYEEHVGRPLSEVPCPDGAHDSYAHHFVEPFLDALGSLGAEPEVRMAHELYGSGAYTEAVITALDHAQDIKAILEEVSGRDLPPTWLPLNVRCTECGRIAGTKPTLYEFPTIEYTCACGHEGSVDVREPGTGKLPWRVDWPARWSFLGVTFEAFGKDHAAAGGSWDTGTRIARDVYDREPPHHTTYEFIHVKGAGAMHSSTGTGVAAEDILEAVPPEVLRFFFMRYQPNRHVELDPGLGLLDLVDEYDRIVAEWASTGASGSIKDVERVLTLSQPSGALPEHPAQAVPMRHLTNVVQVYADREHVLGSLRRSGHVDELGAREAALLDARIERTRGWLERFAPQRVRFTITTDVPASIANEPDAGALGTLSDVLETCAWEPQAIHDATYEAAQKAGLAGKELFRLSYLALLDRPRGPRLGAFLATLEKTWVVKRFRQASQAAGS